MTPSDRRAIPVLLAVVGLFLYFDTTLCPTAGLLGLPCPSCGLTRATVFLMMGEPGKAYELHPAVFLVWPYLLVASVVWLRARGAVPRRMVAVVGGVLLGAMVLLWTARFAGHFGGPVPVHSWSEIWRGRG